MREILFATTPAGPLGPVIRLVDTAVRVACACVLWVTFLAMLAPTFANAVLRYTTNASLIWSVEIVQLTFPWFIMAGAVLAAQHCRHIGVELFVSLLPDGIRRWLAMMVQVTVIGGCLAVIYVFVGFGLFDGGMGFAAGDVAFTSLGVPQSWSYQALLFGYALLGLTALGTIYRLWVGDISVNSDPLADMS